MKKYYKLLSYPFIIGMLITFNSNAISFDQACEYKPSNEYKSGELNIKLKKDDGFYLYIFNELSDTRGFIQDAPDQNLINLGLWYRINNQDYHKKGPERPFNSLDVCIIQNNKTDVDVFYRENNEMVWIDITGVMADDICGNRTYPLNNRNSSGVDCTYYPNGKSDPREIPDNNNVNDDNWTVRLKNKKQISIPTVIQDIPVRLFGEYSTNGGEITTADTFLRSKNEGLLVPKWWVDEYNSNRNEDYLVGKKVNYGGEMKIDHAGNEFETLIEPRFKAKVHYFLKGQLSNLQEKISINPLTQNLIIDLFQYNEFDICCDDSDLNVNANYEKDSNSIRMDGTKINLIAKHNINEGAGYRIGNELIGSNGLISILLDNTATTIDNLMGNGNESFFEGGGQILNAWIWLWEDIAFLTSPIEIYFNISPAILGDFDFNGCIDKSGDLKKLIKAIRSKSSDKSFDLNNDGVVNIADARRLVTLFSNPRGATCP